MQLQKINPGRWLPALCVMALIFVHSAMPADLSGAESGRVVDFVLGILQTFHISADPGLVTFAVRKAAHFTEYFLLGISLARAMAPPRAPLVFFPYFSAWFFGVAYAATDELHQMFVPGRSCELRDVCIDAAGVLAGILLTLYSKIPCLIGFFMERKHQGNIMKRLIDRGESKSNQ